MSNQNVKKRLKKILKYSLIGFGTIVTLVIVLAVWTGQSVAGCFRDEDGRDLVRTNICSYQRAWLLGSNNQLEHCTFEYGNIFYLYGSPSASTGNTIKNCTFRTFDHGLHVQNSTVTISSSLASPQAVEAVRAYYSLVRTDRQDKLKERSQAAGYLQGLATAHASLPLGHTALQLLIIEKNRTGDLPGAIALSHQALTELPEQEQSGVLFNLVWMTLSAVEVAQAQQLVADFSFLFAQQAPGEHTVVWDGRDGAGRQVGSGVYVYKLSVQPAGGRRFEQSRKLVLVR